MFYVLVGSTILTLGFLLALPFLKRTGSLTLAALIAWIFFAGAGQIVGWGANAHFLFAPLPIIVPAFIVEVARYIYRRKQRLAMSLKPLIGLAVVAAAASFWSIVAWAVVTQIPQQELAGGPAYWLLWFSVLLVAAPCFGYMAYRIAKLLPPRTSLAS